jgi:hypothetical protein
MQKNFTAIAVKERLVLSESGRFTRLRDYFYRPRGKKYRSSATDKQRVPERNEGFLGRMQTDFLCKQSHSLGALFDGNLFKLPDVLIWQLPEFRTPDNELLVFRVGQRRIVLLYSKIDGDAPQWFRLVA